MSLFSDRGPISHICDYDSVRISIVGSPDIVLDRPATVSAEEWQSYWGGTPSRGNEGLRRFTEEVALKRHREFIDSKSS